MPGPFRLAEGAWVWFDGLQYEVSALVGGSSVRLIAPDAPDDRQIVTISVGRLLGDSTFRLCTAEEQQGGAEASGGAAGGRKLLVDAVAVMNGLEKADPAELARLMELQAHMLELTTGYRSGDPDGSAEGEPRPQYEPGLPMRRRVEAKAAELELVPQAVWYRLKKWREHGCTLYGLVDRRTTTARLSNPLAGVDVRIIQAIQDQHEIEVDESTGDLNRFKRRVQARLDHEFGKGVLALPSKETFRRWVEEVLPGRHTTGSAQTRRTIANRPGKCYQPVIASRVGEVVMLDSTPLDVIAYDPIGETTYRVELTIAIDVASRSLLAWRFTPEATKAVDAGALIGDAMTPEPMRPHWPEALRHARLKLSCEPLLSEDERFAAAAARPVVYPEKIIIDHGKAYASQAVKDACRRYGISIQDARVYRPTDKPQVEAAFRTIRSQFSQHIAGYKGYKVDQRGRQVERNARYTIAELEEFFAEYVIAVYQRQWHTGLVLPGMSDLDLSPNDAYRILVHRAGYVACPSDPNLYLELLPIRWLTIQHYGIQHDYLIYRSPVIKARAGKRSPYLEMDGKWPIRVDPNDVTRVYFHDPDAKDPSRAWHAIPWTHALSGIEPFTDTTLREVKKIMRERGVAVADQGEIAKTLLDLQNRMDAAETWTAQSRRARVRDAERAQAAARDRAASTLVEPEQNLPPARSILRAVPSVQGAAAAPASGGRGGTALAGGVSAEFEIDFAEVPVYQAWGGTRSSGGDPDLADPQADRSAR